MPNADLQRMRRGGYYDFRWIGVESGFPPPWSGNLMPAYRANIQRGVFEPGLHGFTHFNTSELMACLRENSARGQRARILSEFDVPYLASYTPEYNFALESPRGNERFLESGAQEDWIRAGIELFTRAFGGPPRTVCAPGYRSNSVTRRLWRRLGIESMQYVGTQPLTTVGGLVQLNRNVEFEPVLGERDAVSVALRQAERTVSRGTPIVICTHSINYLTRFVESAERSREMLRELLTSLLKLFPDLRFAGAVEVAKAWKSERRGWFSAPSLHQRANRRMPFSPASPPDEERAA